MVTTNPKEIIEEKIKAAGVKLESPPTSAQELLPLLDEAEILLTRVDQFPSPSMTSALKPTMKALAAKGMLSHPDTDVRVAVTACISEVIRIVAPDAPYDNDLMKDVFKRIVESFEKLDDLTSRSFSKRVSILETMAKVRSCLVMLDLECGDLILEMFRHFLERISLKHDQNLSSSMETIMSLVIAESEEISKELVSMLLQSVRKNRMKRLTVAFKLAEKVIHNCANKLKPLLRELVGNKTNQYSQFVISLCQETSDAMECSDIEAKKVRPKNLKKTKEGPNSKKKDKEAATSNYDEVDSRDIHLEDIVAAMANAKELVEGIANVGELSGSKRKRSPGKEKEKENKAEKKEYKESGGTKEKKCHENVIGKRIKVWWPHDKVFYDGTIEKYNQSDKSHTVVYDDGDIEVLHLREEIWDFLEEDK